MDKIEVTFEITEELYVEWCKNPISTEAKKSRRKSIITQIVALVLCLGIAVLAVFCKYYWLAGGVAAISLVFFYRLFFRTAVAAKKYYKKMREAQTTDKWVRTFIFGENKILVKDANSTSEFRYTDIVNYTDHDDLLCLWRNDSMVFRLPKNAFVSGTPEELIGRFKHITPKEK